MAGTDNSYAAATVYIERSAYAVEMDKRRLEPASARSRRLPRGALLSYPVRTSGQPGQMLSLRLSHGRLAGAALPAKGEVAQRKVPALALTPSRSNASREGGPLPASNTCPQPYLHIQWQHMPQALVTCFSTIPSRLFLACCCCCASMMAKSLLLQPAEYVTRWSSGCWTCRLFTCN